MLVWTFQFIRVPGIPQASQIGYLPWSLTSSGTRWTMTCASTMQRPSLAGKPRIDLEAAERRGDPPYTWEAMRDTLRKKYVPRIYSTRLLMKWLDLRQGKHSMSDYIEEFEEYRMPCKYIEEPQLLIAMFVRGLIEDACADILW